MQREQEGNARLPELFLALVYFKQFTLDPGGPKSLGRQAENVSNCS